MDFTSHLHPMLVHFPIALILTAVLFDIIGLFRKLDTCLSRASLILTGLASLAAIAAYTTGFLFTGQQNLTGVLEHMKNLHMVYAAAATVFISAAFVLKLYTRYFNKQENRRLFWAVLVLMIAAAAAVSAAGIFGGRMVYEYMIGF